jgi:ribosomal protein S18 acetylase RimI-like enzyme
MQRAASGSHPLDNPIWSSLLSRHAGLGTRNGDAARYRPDVSVLMGLAEPTRAALEDLAKIVEPDSLVLGLGLEGVDPGPRWRPGEGVELVQMVCEKTLAEPDLEVAPLGPGDVPDMLELVALTAPGPFLPGTIQMGRYVGRREGGRLVAMAGERLRPDGFTEVSAVCTHPDFQGRGLGEAFVRAVAADIQRRGDVVFLHVYAGNARAIALYERLGFERRRTRAIQPLLRLS